MDKEKQIEEMAKLICLDYNENCHKDCNRSHDCYIEEDIRTIYNAGYRKASEVAREIFEEIDRLILDGTINVRNHLKYSDLKKKYTENKGE